MENVMQYVTIKIGIWRNNYWGTLILGETDNAQAMYNPFVG